MNVSSIGPAIAVTNVQSGKNIPQQPVSKVTMDDDDDSSLSRTVNMRNVSLNEINALIKSGVDGLLDVVPFIPPHIINKYGSEYAANLKIDFLGQVEGSIKLKKSMGEDAAFLEKVLDNLKKIDAMGIPRKLDVRV